jgi:hypothetical protein
VHFPHLCAGELVCRRSSAFARVYGHLWLSAACSCKVDGPADAAGTVELPPMRRARASAAAAEIRLFSSAT